MSRLCAVVARAGMQLFARRFVFDRTGHAVQIGTPEWSNPFQVTIASSNFDDLIAAFTTVFQILSGGEPCVRKAVVLVACFLTVRA